jgi:hypothetical protein
MGDLWEVENHLDPTSDSGDDGPDGDPDADGSSNIREMLAGTDPWSAASVFTIVSVESNPPSVTIMWTTAKDKHYRILTADNLDGPWTPIADGLLGTGEVATFADEQAGANGRRFYKVEVH